MKLSILLLLISFNALAVDPVTEPETIRTCNMPNEREDGTALALNEIMLVNFYISATSGSYAMTDPYQSRTDKICQVVIDNTKLSDGTYYIAGTVTDTEWRESALSIERTHVVKRTALPKSQTWAVSP